MSFPPIITTSKGAADVRILWTSADILVQQLQDSFAKTLIGRFKKMNLECARVQDAKTITGPALVQGEFTTIAAGNPRARIIIGFGRGASDLETHVTISEVFNGQRTILLECNIDSKSGKKPGAILSTNGGGFAVGVATGYFGDKRSATVQADASRMAKLIGKQTKAIMVAQQWIPKPSGCVMLPEAGFAVRRALRCRMSSVAFLRTSFSART